MLPLLRAITSFSLLRGVIAPENLVALARRMGYESLAICDYINLYGLPEFLAACRVHCVKPIVGAEVPDGDSNTVLLYADGHSGYAHLCRIISGLATGESATLSALLTTYRDGIHVVAESEQFVTRFSATGPAYFRLERPLRLPAWVRARKIPCLITPPVVFRNADDYRTHRLLQAIDKNTILSRLDAAQLLPENALFVPPDEIAERFELFEEAIKTTQLFARQIVTSDNFGATMMPRYFAATDPVALLRNKTYAGARVRYGTLTERVQQRIEYELDLIISKGFADYFLIVDDIVRQSPRTCGRGSGAASIVAYSLGITNVDPIRYNLMFERFLNPERSDPPDIDIDFAWDERESVLDYVFERYGKEHTAMVATHQTCGARMAIRETARVYGLTEHEIGTVTKKIPWFVDLPDYVEDLVGLLRQWPSLQNVPLDPPWPDILRDAGKIIGLPRGIGTHCGGVIMTPEPIRSVAPVQNSAKGYPIVQWEKEGVEAMGLVKIDLLGNRSLAVIRDAVASLKHDGHQFDDAQWDPQSDPETIRLLAEGRTMGVFYVESPAMRLLQRKSRRGDFDSLVIHSSIIRPAANKYIQEYVRRLGGAPWKPLHPLLEDAFAETFGIMVYQEDVSKAAMALAGFSAGEADKLRKIMSKKAGTATFDDYRHRFFTGAAARGVGEEVIRQVWEMMESFRGYSFCKPHSASYVQVSFQSAWLKAHYPAHFMAAVLSNYGGFYTTQAYISEAMRLGVKIVAPDVNRSSIAFRATGASILVGLCQIKGLSDRAMQTIIATRENSGPYESIPDLLERTGIDEKDAEKLLLAGAADAFASNLSRPQQFWALRSFYRSKNNEPPPPLRNISISQFLQYQYRTLGFLTECHPITLVTAKRPPIRAKNVDSCVGKNISLFGWCVTSKTVSTKMGDSMEFVTFEDETGIFETVFFPDVYRQYSALLAWQMAFLVRGKVTEEFGVAVVEVGAVERV